MGSHENVKLNKTEGTRTSLYIPSASHLETRKFPSQPGGGQLQVPIFEL